MIYRTVSLTIDFDDIADETFSGQNFDEVGYSLQRIILVVNSSFTELQHLHLVKLFLQYNYDCDSLGTKMNADIITVETKAQFQWSNSFMFGTKVNQYWEQVIWQR